MLEPDSVALNARTCGIADLKLLALPYQFSCRLYEFIFETCTKEHRDGELLVCGLSHMISDICNQLHSRGLYSAYRTIEMPIKLIMTQAEHQGITIDYRYLLQITQKVKSILKNVETVIFSQAKGKFDLDCSKKVAQVLQRELSSLTNFFTIQKNQSKKEFELKKLK